MARVPLSASLTKYRDTMAHRSGVVCRLASPRAVTGAEGYSPTGSAGGLTGGGACSIGHHGSGTEGAAAQSGPHEGRAAAVSVARRLQVADHVAWWPGVEGPAVP